MKNYAKHTSASASHYDKEAEHYDSFNEDRSAQMNQLIENVLREHGVHSVLDLTCGTGSQVFYLAKSGFEITGIDISDKMLSIACLKAQQKGLDIDFKKGDMRTSQLGQFDAVLTIFNSIGHLTKADFEIALKNIHANLKPGGLYLFDIFNLNYLLYKDNITKLTIDWQKVTGDVTAREIQYSTISTEGVLTSYDIYHENQGNEAPKIRTACQTLQVYNADQLQALLEKHGFKVIQQIAADGTILKPDISERIFSIAEKAAV